MTFRLADLLYVLTVFATALGAFGWVGVLLAPWAIAMWRGLSKSSTNKKGPATVGAALRWLFLFGLWGVVAAGAVAMQQSQGGPEGPSGRVLMGAIFLVLVVAPVWEGRPSNPRTPQ